MNKHIILLVILFSSMNASAQGGIEITVNKLFANIRENKNEMVDVTPIYEANKTWESIKIIHPYTLDSLYKIRLEAYRMENILGTKSTDASVKKEVVNHLLQGCADKEAGVIEFCSSALQNYQQEHYDNVARKKLKELLNYDQKYLDKIILLAGFIGEDDYKSILINLSNDEIKSKRTKWNIDLALSRMGNKNNITRVISRIRTLEVNDDVLLEIGPALVYIRQKEAIDYLLSIIQSDLKNCTSAHPDFDNEIPCAYRAMEIAAPVVKGFPVSVDTGGDIEVNDYEVALKNVRNWIDENEGKYSIVTNTF